MKDDNERIQIAFHTSANAVFFTFLKSFEEATKEVNRQNEEYKFQQAKEAHIQSLKQQLENCAMQLLQRHSHNLQAQELSQNLQHHIQEYLHAFVQKTRTV